MRAGDVVKHQPTGETWVLACAERDEVYPCGWPETIAKEKDCILVEAGSEKDYREMLESWSDKSSYDSSEGGANIRVLICRNQLQKLNQLEETKAGLDAWMANAKEKNS